MIVPTRIAQFGITIKLQFLEIIVTLINDLNRVLIPHWQMVKNSPNQLKRFVEINKPDTTLNL